MTGARNTPEAVMPGRTTKATRVDEAAAIDQAAIQRALGAARSRIRWRRAVRGVAAALFVPVLAAAAWAYAARFTMLGLPRWPPLAFLLAWLIALLLWSRADRISPAQSARFLDRALALDERVSTFL